MSEQEVKKTVTAKAKKAAAPKKKAAPKKSKAESKNAVEGFVSKAVLKNFRNSPQKARLVADLIRGKECGRAVEILETCTKKSAPVIKKLLLSAVSNARLNSGIDVDELFVKSIWVTEGMKLKRFLPRAQGRATPLIKRHSTITVILDERVR